MADETHRKIIIKFVDPPLKGEELDEYAEVEKLKIHKFADETQLIGIIFGEEGELKGMLGLEVEKWVDRSSFHPDYDLLERVRVKLFNKGGSPEGVIEERLIKELAMPTSSHQLPIFTVSLQGLPYAVDIDRDSDKFVFALMTNPRKGMIEIFQISKKLLRSSFEVKRKYLVQKVASINPKWGGKFEIKIHDEELARIEPLTQFLILFTATIKFHDEIVKKIQDYNSSLADGTLVISAPKKALELMSKSPLGIYAESEPKVKPEPKIEPVIERKIELVEPTTPGARVEAQIQRGERKIRAKRRELVSPPVETLEKKPVREEKVTIPPERVEPSTPGTRIEAQIQRGERKIRAGRREPASPPITTLEKKPAREEKSAKPQEVAMADRVSKEEILREAMKREIELASKPYELTAPPKRKTPSATDTPEEAGTSLREIDALYLEDSISKIKGISDQMKEILPEIGIEIVDDLIFIDPGALAEFIGIRSITKDKVKDLQDRAHQQIKETLKYDQELKEKYLAKYKERSNQS